MMKPVYIVTKDTQYGEDGGLEIIAVYETEKEANCALERYKEEHNVKNGTHIWYEVQGYRVRNYDIRSIEDDS